MFAKRLQMGGHPPVSNGNDRRGFSVILVQGDVPAALKINQPHAVFRFHLFVSNGDGRPHPITAWMCHSEGFPHHASNRSLQMEIKTIGIDLAKNVFQVHALDSRGKVVLLKPFCRDR
ncbi:hypothetical protein Acife_3223 [Acidithiobacillus ferrivorans SS3]|uniref:Transposase n=1 Tax=Acidithiobacillus ferrivorans SS3 TaxID=743299 RepID=G0JLX2_9PROT|nr:hypothetical protein Acife_3223 [Acidithiobacillus ferrivorans SS3]